MLWSVPGRAALPEACESPTKLRIEHRHLPELDAGLYSECQAALLNLEEFLTTEFGARYALADGWCRGGLPA